MADMASIWAKLMPGARNIFSGLPRLWSDHAVKRSSTAYPSTFAERCTQSGAVELELVHICCASSTGGNFTEYATHPAHEWLLKKSCRHGFPSIVTLNYTFYPINFLNSSSILQSNKRKICGSEGSKICA